MQTPACACVRCQGRTHRADEDTRAATYMDIHARNGDVGASAAAMDAMVAQADGLLGGWDCDNSAGLQQ